MTPRIILATALLWAVPAAAADYCKLFLHTNQNTELFNAQLAASDEYTVLAPFGEPWTSSSARLTGPDMKTMKPGTWWQASSARMQAIDSDVYLYLFTGEHFDGDVSSKRCPKGQTCIFNFTDRNMNDKVKSFICQRDFPDTPLPPNRVPVGHAQDDGSTDIIEIPTAAFVDGVRDIFLAEVGPNTGGGWYSPLETQVSWTTLDQACDFIDGLTDFWTRYHAQRLCTHRDATAKYKDMLYIRHSFELEGCETFIFKFCESGTPTVHMWVRPVLEGGKLVFKSDWQNDNGYFTVVTPEENDLFGTLTSNIWNAVNDKFNGGNDDLGPILTEKVAEQVEDSVCCSKQSCNIHGGCSQNPSCSDFQTALCETIADSLVLGNKERLQMVYSWFPLFDYNQYWTDPEVATAPSTYWWMEAFYPVPVRSLTPVIRLNQERAFLPPDGREEDDTKASAKALSVGTQKGLTCTDDDWFVLQRSVGDDPIDIKLWFYHSAGDLDVELVDPNGALVAYSRSSSDNETIYHLPTVSGAYHIHVYGYRGATNKYNIFMQ